MISSVYSVRIDDVSKKEWCDLLQLFSDSSIYQTWSLGSNRWGHNFLSHLILCKGEEIVAMAQVGIKKLPIINGGIATVYWGPIWRTKDRPADYVVLDKMIEALAHEYVTNRGFLLRIWPTGLETSAAETIEVLRHHSFVHNPNVQPYRTLILNLSPSLEDLRKNLAQKWRNKLNLAERSSLNLIEGSSDEMYLTFLTLLHETLSRKNFQSGVDYDKYRQIQNDLPQSLKMKLAVCNSDGEPVSAAVFSAIGETCTYLFGATADRGLKANGAYLIQWAGIKWLKEKGYQWYDLGGIDPLGNPGVYRFKLGLAGKTGKEVLHCGQFYLAKNLTGYILNTFTNWTNIVRMRLHRS